MKKYIIKNEIKKNDYYYKTFIYLLNNNFLPNEFVEYCKSNEVDLEDLDEFDFYYRDSVDTKIIDGYIYTFKKEITNLQNTFPEFSNLNFKITIEKNNKFLGFRFQPVEEYFKIPKL